MFIRSYLLNFLLVFLFALCAAPAFAQRSSGFSGKSWGVGYDFFLHPSKTVITQTDTKKELEIGTATRGFRTKVGFLFLTKNFIYLMAGSQAAGEQDIETKGVYTEDTTGTNLSFRQTAQFVGIGYTYFIGNVGMRSINFFGGLEVGQISYSNYFISSNIFLYEHTEGSSSMSRIYAGSNFLLGSADFHLELFYLIAPGAKDTPLSSRDGQKYTESSSFDSVGFTFGINNYF